MSELTPLYVDLNSVYSGDELGLPYRDIMGEGVVKSTDLAVTERGAGANLSVDIAAGACWVLGDSDTAAQPCYRCRNDAVVNLGITPDGSNPRKVIVVAEVLDTTFDASGSRLWRLRAIHGTPAPSPAEPALPISAIKLALVDVAAGAVSITNANITDTRARSKVGGGQARTSILVRDAGIDVGTRAAVNFLDTGDVAFTATDDSTNDEVELTGSLRAGHSAPGDYGTALPSSGLFNGYRFALFVSGLPWDLIYRADLDATYPWHVLGALPIRAEVTASEGTGTTSYTSTGFTALTVALPRPGTYDVEIGAFCDPGSNNSFGSVFMSYDIGATGAVDADAVVWGQNGSTDSRSKSRRKSGLGAVTLTMKYKHGDATGGTSNWSNRYFAVTPVKIG